jgi:RNA ligase
VTRKLASIQKIVNIEPIPDADAIEKATVLGWEVVIAKKDNLKINDLVCYIEVDSIVPPKPEFEFLKERKYRIRTIKLRKQISQGLILPLNILPSKKYNEGDDVTDIIGVKKYDPQADAEEKLAKEVANRTNNRIKKFMMQYPWYRRLFLKPKKGGWPKFISKTDEDRIQLFPDICNKEANTIFGVTEKIDGQSGTWFLLKKEKYNFLGFKFGNSFEFGVCSRNLHLPKENDSSYWCIARKYNIRKVLERLIGDNQFVAIQGEIIGPGIQANKYKVSEYEMYAFNLIFPDKKIDTKTAAFILEEWGIKFVPVLDNNFKLKPSIHENVDYAKGKSILVDGLREGVVCRNYEKNLSFKIVNPEFLLKYEE